jgi:hypothetical protein
VRPRILGSPRVAVGACFHAPFGRLTHSSSPEAYGYESGSFSLEATPPQSAFLSTPALSFRIEQLPAVVFYPHSTIQQRVYTREDVQILASFRPQAISTSRRFTPHHCLQACFIPQPSPGLFSRSRACPLRAAVLSHRESPAPSSLAQVRSPACEWPRILSLDLEALLHTKSRAVSLVISLPHGRSPHRVFGSSRCFHRRRYQLPGTQHS